MYNEMDDIFKPIVMITGFGPFINHPVNASWEAVKLMNKEEIEKKHNIQLIQQEISVTYEDVNKFVPAIWDTFDPKLMIHVGVSSSAECLTLEMQAHRKGYHRKDHLDNCPVNYTCPAEGGVRLHTKLNVEQLCKEFNDSCPPEHNTKALPSKDAGRFLCEYIYYTSLCKDNSRTLFVHVPDMHVYSAEQTARSLEHLLDLCLAQLQSDRDINDKLNNVSLKEDNRL
ncbi:unnamed protein product [Diatraea saccharalis]|uniref:Pyroglutamyl-peptidase 1 n=1 Tax=Diatraea saccharalis TaxID=40085 RepID=A0A9N9WLR6_9NEOP|nr:unnamed protein product [Diatraea saccharalis]